MSSELNWQAPSKRHSKTTKNINIPPSMFLTEPYSAFMGKKPRRQRTAGKAVQYLRIRIRESRSSCRSDTIAAIFCGIQPKKAIRAMITAIQKKLSPPPNTRWKREESPLPWPAEAILKLISYSLLSCAAGKIRSRRLQSACSLPVPLQTAPPYSKAAHPAGQCQPRPVLTALF